MLISSLVEWPRFPFEEGRSDGFVLESEVLQQVGGKVVESLNQSRARSCPVLRTKRIRAGFDLIKQARYLAMIVHQLVHHRTKSWIRAPESRKESDVLGMMVSMHKVAIIAAVDAQF